MRFHQSHYRATVLGVPFGHGPNAGDARRYSNMLDPVSAQAGLNYLSPLIFAKVKDRLAAGGGVLEPYRLLHNMLSSQPMCFNLFGPLVDAPERASRLLGALIGDDLARVTRVSIEWAPAPPTSTSTTARPSTPSSSMSAATGRASRSGWKRS